MAGEITELTPDTKERQMESPPYRVQQRLQTAIPKFRKILERGQQRDVNESDTVTIVIGMLEEIFGFDKYTDITREYAIQGTYCDLAIKTGETIEYLLEVKAIGLELNNRHLRQAVNYAAKEGIRWVVLTNGMQWIIHRITLNNKVQHEKIFEIDMMTINPKQKDHQLLLFLLCKRGVMKDLIDDFYEYKQSVNRYTVGNLLTQESVTTAVRKELRKMKPGIKVETDEIQHLIENDVIKREIFENDEGIEAKKQINRFLKKQGKLKNKNAEEKTPPHADKEGSEQEPSAL